MGCQASKMFIVTTNLGKRCFSGVKNPCLPLGGSDGLCSEREWVREPLHSIFRNSQARAFFPFKSLGSTSAANSQGDTSVPISVQAPGMKGWDWPTPAGHFLQGSLELWLWWQVLAQMDSYFSSICFFPRNWYWPVQKIQTKISFAISPLCPRELRRKTRTSQK